MLEKLKEYFAVPTKNLVVTMPRSEVTKNLLDTEKVLLSLHPGESMQLNYTFHHTAEKKGTVSDVRVEKPLFLQDEDCEQLIELLAGAFTETKDYHHHRIMRKVQDYLYEKRRSNC